MNDTPYDFFENESERAMDKDVCENEEFYDALSAGLDAAERGETVGVDDIIEDISDEQQREEAGGGPPTTDFDDWEDISHKSFCDYQWQYDGGKEVDWKRPSISVYRCKKFDFAYAAPWSVEFYPNETGDYYQTRHDTMEEAAQRVAELMEELP